MSDIINSVVVQALLQLLGLSHLCHLVLGVVIGLSIGILPGLGGMSGMAFVLPFVYGMDPASAFAMMIGLTSVTTTSDTFPSILLGVPGTSSSQATVVDGYPLALQGRAGHALAAAFSASMVGGVFGAFVLTFAVFLARPLLLLIGFGEQFLLLMLSLVAVGMLAGHSMFKGLAACGLGLLVGAVGSATATAEYRMNFGSLYLADGIPLIPVALGLFALPEIVDSLRFRERIADRCRADEGRLAGLNDVWVHRGIVLRCSALGAMFGALPGIGGSVIDWLAYGHVIQTARDKTQFGKGDIRGVIGPESANNAKEGGALVPTLLFGIPGSGTMALFLAGMVLIGVQPGRQMVEENLSLTYLIIWSIAVANIVGAGICFALAPPISRLTAVKYTRIAPFLIVIVFFAAYQASGDWGDLVALMLFGLLATFMKLFGWSRPALLIGVVLSQELEAAFYRTAQIHGFGLLTRPLALIILAAVILSALAIWRARGRKGVWLGERTWGDDRRLPQLLFAGVLLLVPIIAIVDTHDLNFLGRIFPITAAAITAALILAVIVQIWIMPRRAPDLFEATAVQQRNHRRPGFLFCFALVGGLLGLSALIGYLLAAPIYVALFLRYLGGTGWFQSAFVAVTILAALAALNIIFDLEYAQGWLQSIMDFGWPLSR